MKEWMQLKMECKHWWTWPTVIWEKFSMFYKVFPVHSTSWTKKMSTNVVEFLNDQTLKPYLDGFKRKNLPQFMKVWNRDTVKTMTC